MLKNRSSLPRSSCAVTLALSAFVASPHHGQAADIKPGKVVLTSGKPMPAASGSWTNPPADPALLKGNGKGDLTLESGWYTAGGAAFGLYPPMPTVSNQGIRAKFKYVTGGTADVAVRRHTDAQGVTHSYSLRLDEKGLLSLVEFSNITAKNEIQRKNLLKDEPKFAVKDGDEVLLELVAIGDQLTAKVNGQVVAMVNGASTVPGKAHTYASLMSTGGLEWLNLDGMSEVKARTAAGLTQSPSAPAGLPAVPTIQGDPEAQQHVSEIDGKFRTLYDQLAGKAYQTGVDQLNQNYVAALKREEIKAQQKGSLEEVLIYQNEAQSVNAGTGTDTIPNLVKTMHETYAKAKIKLESERDKRSQPAFEAYSKALSLYTTELTKAGRIDAARQVKNVHDTLIKPAS